MTLQQLEYVISLYRFKHFAKAAEHCKVSQPTLSSMIHKLEEEFGLKIFDRNAQPIAPTPTGKLIIEQAWRVLKSAEKIKDIIEEERSSLDGTFHIGILPHNIPLPHSTILPTDDAEISSPRPACHRDENSGNKTGIASWRH